jgi:hypothetical protein
VMICSGECLVRFIVESLQSPAGACRDSHSDWFSFRGAGHRAEADLNRDGVIDGDDGRTIHGYTIPTGPKQGLPGARRHSWYVARPEFFEFIYGPDVAPTGDGRLSGRNDVLSRWRGIGAP